MLKKAMFLIILFAACSLMAESKYHTAMGLHFGISTGNGYSVRTWGTDNAYQFTFAAYATGDKDPDYKPSDFYNHDYRDARKNSLSLGVNYLWGLLRAESYDFYLITGGSFTYRKVKRYSSAYDSRWVQDNRWAIGVGPGFEFEFSDRFHVAIEVPMTYNHKDDITMYIPSGGFYYYFK